MATGAELGYNTGATAMQMANTIFGDGVTVTGASYSGATNSSAIYTNGDLAAGVTPSDTGVIFSTGNAASFTQSSGDPNRSTGTSTNTSGVDNNAQFNALAGTRTYDAAYMDVDFIPTGDTMTLQFVFASEEYPEYVGSQFNDVVGVWVNGTVVPISIRADTFGAHRTLKVSPQHRILLRDSLAELLFGETEVLVAAKDLVNDRSVTVCEGGSVEYVHLLFDRHQVVWSEGLASESYLPGPQITHSVECAIVAEICALFPEIAPDTGAGYGASVRRTLRSFEAQVLFAAARAA